MHFFKRYQIISSFMPKICISDQSKQNLWEVIQKWPLTSLLVKEVNRKSLRVFWKWFHEKKEKLEKSWRKLRQIKLEINFGNSNVDYGW